METAVEVYKNRTKRIKTSVLNDDLLPIIENYPPPALKGNSSKSNTLCSCQRRNHNSHFSVIYHNM